MDVKKTLLEFPCLKERESADGIKAFDCPKSHLERFARYLRDVCQYNSLTDMASIDMGEEAGEARFGVVYHFFSHDKKRYVRVVCMCDSSDEPSLPSLCSVYKGADWLEREAFDMMGIAFEGHPNLHRILMWDSYPWHPLRKDFPLCGKEAPLPESFEGNEDAAKVVPAPENGGPFHSPSCGTKFASEREPRARFDSSSGCKSGTSNSHIHGL